MFFLGRGESNKRGLEFLLEVESVLSGEVEEESLDCGVREDEHFLGFLCFLCRIEGCRMWDWIVRFLLEFGEVKYRYSFNAMWIATKYQSLRDRTAATDSAHVTLSSLRALCPGRNKSR